MKLSLIHRQREIRESRKRRGMKEMKGKEEMEERRKERGKSRDGREAGIKRTEKGSTKHRTCVCMPLFGRKDFMVAFMLFPLFIFHG